MFLLPQSSLEIKTTSRKERGVFAKKDIEGGTVIGDYLGIITAEKDEDEVKNGTYYLWYSNHSSIYADPKKPGIHFINHSCMPNCAMYTLGTHTLYFALRKIFKGEELTVSYDLGYPDKDCNPCEHACFCDTPLCTGTMHSSEDVSIIAADDYTPQTYLSPGNQLPFLEHYPKKIRDIEVDKIFGSLKHRWFICYDKKLPSLSRLRKKIRETGRVLNFINMKMKVYGLEHGFVISKI